MPLVRIRYKPFLEPVRSTHDCLVNLTGVWRAGIAEALSCGDPGGHLNADEIEIYLDPAMPGDENTPEVSVDIEAMYYPARKANHQQRADKIREMFLGWFVPLMMPPPTIGVWLKLVNAAWSGDD